MKIKSQYDIVFLTNTPSFYKLNLFNEIAKNKSVLLVFLGYTKDAVNTQLSDNQEWQFDSYFLYQEELEKRPKFKCFLKIIRLLISIKYQRLLYTGWYIPEYILMLFLTPKSKNVIVSESTINEGKRIPLLKIIKRTIINRSTYALASGQPHKELMEKLGFKGTIAITGGVGLIHNYQQRPLCIKKSLNPIRFLYIGRIIELKNLQLLVQVFNELNLPLTIVGTGALQKELTKQAKPNISFQGFVPNHELIHLFNNHHVLILPSKAEPWGLVVDEALYNGLPVIVSNKVGSAFDLVESTRSGIVFEWDSIESLTSAIKQMITRYEYYITQTKNIDYKKRNQNQINAYNTIFEH